MLCKKYYFEFLFFLDAFVCNVSSPSYNTVEVSCKLLGILARIHVTMISTNCTITLNTTLDDNPVVFHNLSAGNYTVDIAAVDIGNVSIMRTIEVSDDATIENTPTTENSTTAENTTTTENTPTNKNTPTAENNRTTENTPTTEGTIMTNNCI